VRIIVATNRDLEHDAASGRFRPDLYYRLNVFPIYIPPLRERGSDIILLADFFVGKYASQLKKNIKRISPAVIDRLLAYHWPGNVRELENCIERAALLADGDIIDAVHLPPSMQMNGNSSPAKKQGTFASLVDAYERSLIVEALKESGGNQSKAARMLGSTKRVVQYKVEKLGIDVERFKARS
jgi:Nif-specific regulatory protein